MKKFGIISGIRQISMNDYYRIKHHGIPEKLGGLYFESCLLFANNYTQVKSKRAIDDWETSFLLLCETCYHLQSVGVSGILLYADSFPFLPMPNPNEPKVPLLNVSIIDSLDLANMGIKKIGLAGTQETIEIEFFESTLFPKNLEAILPPLPDRIFVHDTLFKHIGKNILQPKTKKKLQQIFDLLIHEGAEALLIGCATTTPIFERDDIFVPTFDNKRKHPLETLEFDLGYVSKMPFLEIELAST